MPYPALQLISDAFFAANIVGRSFESVSGEEANNGLRWLNELIGKKVIASSLIPYEGNTTFTSVVGQEEYLIPNLIEVDTLTFISGEVRYSMRRRPRHIYHGAGRPENVESFPSTYFVERELGGARIYLYWLPDAAYEFTIYGVFRLSEIADLQQDLSLTLDPFYIAFLKYELSQKFCLEYGEPVPPAVLKEIKEYTLLISKQSRPLDLTTRKIQAFPSRPGINWADINFQTRGFYPPGWDGW